MKTKPIGIAIVLFVTLSSLGVFNSPNNNTSYITYSEIERPIIAQDGQVVQNISSYLDFALVTGSIIADKFVKTSDGLVYHNGDFDYVLFLNGSTLPDYYWAISSLSRVYDLTGNATFASIISKMAVKMVALFGDTEYPGYYINTMSEPILAQTKRAGIQAYAYEALSIAENVNSSLDFTDEKQSALDCLTNMLYDSENGGFYFFTLRNGSLDIPDIIYEIYPNTGKRLDHLALGITTLYNAGEATGNDTLTAMANESLSFLIEHMPYFNNTYYYGLKLAVEAAGDALSIEGLQRPAHTVLTDVNAIAIRALLKGYEITGNDTYLDWAEETVEALLYFNWDPINGAWFAETLDGEVFDPTYDEDVKWFKYAEIQFQMVLTLEVIFEATSWLPYIQLIIDTLDRTLRSLWDIENGGFYRNSDREGIVPSEIWQTHLVAVQGLGVLALERIWSYGLPIISNVLINPTSPRPNDNVTFLVTALDDDGIDAVFVNLTIEYANESTVISVIELAPNTNFVGLFNNTMGVLPDGTGINFMVFVNDTLGNVFIAGSYHFVVQIDEFSPVVLLREIYPAGEVLEGQDVFIEIGTYEFPTHSAIVSCQLFWKVNDNDYAPMNMTWIDIDIDYMVWIADLGHFSANDVISYYCLAIDETGNVGESAFYRLTIHGPYANVNPYFVFQVVLAIGLVTAPGVGYVYIRARREDSKKMQRDLKKAQRKKKHRGPTTRRKR